ncbi:type II secretion system F family protein [Candidatus Pacearchaeota archaeon]|nr:type II secretion system F family protein [Candidatus Pacearchaeota archaeon]
MKKEIIKKSETKTLQKKKTKEKGFGRRKEFLIAVIAGLLVSTLFAIFTKSFLKTVISFFAFFVLFVFYFIVKARLKKNAEIRRMEEVFPDLIELMASNLRAGMTTDRALLLSSRKEFAPLDKEILQVGKDIVTGKEMTRALEEMAIRINSEKIKKTVLLINSGIRAGGNLSVLLEETAINMREKEFVEKRAASNVLMYVIFIFFAVSVGAPILFGLSSVLVEILTNVLANVELPSGQGNVNVPFTLTKVGISVNFIVYFSALFIIITDVLASLVLGLVRSGNEKDGLKYTLILILISISVFFATRGILLNYFSDFFR